MAGLKTRRQQAEISAVVGSNLKRIRLLAGLSQETLGERLGITFQQVQKYERGTNRISAPVLVQLAAILSVDIADFFAGCTPNSNVKGISSNPIPNLSQRTIDLAERLNTMPPGKARDGLFSLIEAMSE